MNDGSYAGFERRGRAASRGPRYPDTQVQLSGTDGNAFAVLGKVDRALRKAGATDEELRAFRAEATSGDYDHLLATCMRWVDVC